MSEENELSFADEIFLDTDALDYEASKQAGRYKYFNELWANACFIRDSAKTTLELRKSEVYVDILFNFKDHGFSAKPAETAIKHMVNVNEDVQAAEREYNEYVEMANDAYGLRQAWEHKKSMIEVCGKLYPTGYFSETRLPREAQDAISDRTTKILTECIENHPRLMKLKEKRNGEKN